MVRQEMAEISIPVDDIAEERIWFEQVQYPDEVLGHLVSFRKKDGVDVFGIAASLDMLGWRLPDLVARYSFDGDMLRKSDGRRLGVPIVFAGGDCLGGALRSFVSCVKRRLSERAVHPLIGGIVVVKEDVYIAILIHEIMVKRHSLMDIIESVADACGGGQNVSVSRMAGALEESGSVSLEDGDFSLFKRLETGEYAAESPP